MLQMQIDDLETLQAVSKSSCVESECQHRKHAVTGLRQGLRVCYKNGDKGAKNTQAAAVQQALFPHCFRSQTYIGKHTNRQHI